MDEIVTLLWQRDEQALPQMERQYGGLCRRILSGILPCVCDAEEALNDVWFRIWNSIPPAKPKYFRAYLAKTARNTALHHLERTQAQKRSSVTVLLDELAECIPAPSAVPEPERIALKEVLNRFVRSLKKKERSFFVRRYYFGESIQEIAKSSGCTENSVSVTLFRTREKLRLLLQQEEYTI